jgi:hypothetical protein
MTYEITCKRCGNCVEIEAEDYHRAGRVQCHCGSTDLEVKQPPPTSEELVVGFRSLKMCPYCRGAGWIDADDGGRFPCGACAGGRQ